VVGEARQSLLGEAAFLRWASADGVSLVGSAVTTVVLPLVVYEATGSAAETGALFAVRVIPYLLFGAIAGPVADRGNRRRLIIGGNLIEGVLIATIPVAHLLGVLTVAQVYVVGLLSAAVFVFADAAVFGAVPALVGTDRLAAANGLLGSISSGAEIVGPAIGGVLAATIGATNAVWLDATSFFVAAAMQSTIRSTFRISDARDGPLLIRAQIRRALRFVRQHRTLASLLAIGFGNSLAYGAVIGLTVPYAVERLHLASHDSRIGLLYSASGLGALVAGVTFARLFRMSRVRWISPGVLATATVMIAGLTVTNRWLTAVALLTVFTWGTATAITTGITYRQIVAPDDLRSSVNVLGRMIAWGGQPFGAAIGAAIAGARDVYTAYAVATVVMAVSAVGGGIALRWSTRADTLAQDDWSQG
jgi:MFS family permease